MGINLILLVAWILLVMLNMLMIISIGTMKRDEFTFGGKVLYLFTVLLPTVLVTLVTFNLTN